MDLTGHWQFYNIKVDPDLSIELQDRFPDFIRPGFHMNKRHWISVDFSSNISRIVEQNLIRHAYEQTAKGLSKRMRRDLGFE